MTKKFCIRCNKLIDRTKDRRNARKFCSYECFRLSLMGRKRSNLMQSGEFNPNWRGGKRLTKYGYILIYSPSHPTVSKNNKYVFEHRLIMEKHLGRYLKSEEVIHHKNSLRNDNRLENLELMNNGKHSTLHGKLRIIPPRFCSICGTKHKGKGYCNLHYQRFIRGTLEAIR